MASRVLHLAAQTPAWAVRDEDRRIERTFKFKNFAEAFAFTKRAGDLAEAEGHHPDISFGWGYATVSPAAAIRVLKRRPVAKS